MKLFLSAYAMIILSTPHLVLSQDPVCTLLPDDERLEQRLQYPTFKLPCPQVGGRVNVEYAFRKTLREAPGSITKASLAMTVAHTGAPCSVAGISYGVSIVDSEDTFSCLDLPTNLDDFIFDRVSGENVITGCEFWNGLSDVGGWCQSVGLGDAGSVNKKALISIWNDGGCQGDLIVNAVLSDDLASTDAIASGEPASVCLSGFAQVCEEIDGGNSTGTFDPERVCGDQEPPDSGASTNTMAPNTMAPNTMAPNTMAPNPLAPTNSPAPPTTTTMSPTTKAPSASGGATIQVTATWWCLGVVALAVAVSGSNF